MCLLKSITASKAKPVTTRYIGVVIQNGLTPSRRSLIVPPPIAVARPTTYAPNQSNFFAEANLIPLITKSNVPIIAIAYIKVAAFNVYN